jgi:hypothetical protein
MSQCTAFNLRQVDGNTSLVHIVFMLILEYLHKNLSPIEWKPSYRLTRGKL